MYVHVLSRNFIYLPPVDVCVYFHSHFFANTHALSFIIDGFCCSIGLGYVNTIM